MLVTHQSNNPCGFKKVLPNIHYSWQEVGSYYCSHFLGDLWTFGGHTRQRLNENITTVHINQTRFLPFTAVLNVPTVKYINFRSCRIWRFIRSRKTFFISVKCSTTEELFCMSFPHYNNPVTPVPEQVNFISPSCHWAPSNLQRQLRSFTCLRCWEGSVRGISFPVSQRLENWESKRPFSATFCLLQNDWNHSHFCRCRGLSVKTK